MEDERPRATSAGQAPRYFNLVMAAFVAILLLSNVIGAGKRAVIDLPFVGPWPFGAGILFSPSLTCSATC